MAASRTARRPQFTLRSRLGGVSKGGLLRMREMGLPSKVFLILRSDHRPRLEGRRPSVPNLKFGVSLIREDLPDSSP